MSPYLIIHYLAYLNSCRSSTQKSYLASIRSSEVRDTGYIMNKYRNTTSRIDTNIDTQRTLYSR